jgi:hypothetical protein
VVAVSFAAADGKPTVVITHHAPSREGLNPDYRGDGLAGAYASHLDPWIEELDGVPMWIHGHTHIRRRYRIGATELRTDARGLDGRDLCARSFTGQSRFEV